MPEISNRLGNLPPYVFATIGKQIRQMKANGIDVIRLDIGSPDLPPPDHVINALEQSARNPAHHGYSGYSGTPTFREAIARHYQRRFGVILDPDRNVLPLLGSKEGIVNLALAYLNPGDVALVPAVGYPSYAMGARLAGAEAVFMPMTADNDFIIDYHGIDEADLQRTKLLWANYPNNPTGAVVDRSFYDDVVAFCAEHDILFASDNPYVDVTFGDEAAPSALQATDALHHAIEFMSMSKTYNMAGWRLGAAVGNAEALQNLLQIKSNMDSGHFIGVYDAGIDALENTSDEWMCSRNERYAKRQQMILNALPHLGLDARPSAGTLYVWARVLEMDADEYATRARTEAHVSLAPGAAYGPGGDGYVRISISVPEEQMQEGLERLQAWYSQHAHSNRPIAEEAS